MAKFCPRNMCPTTYCSTRRCATLALQAQSLVSGPHPDGPDHPEKIEINQPKHPKQLLFQQLCSKINPWGRPCSWPTPGSLWCLDPTQMVLAVQKYPKITNIIVLNNFCFNNFAQKSIPGDVRAQVLQEPVGASHGDQGRKSGLPSVFSLPGGQAESNGTP